MLLQNEYLTVPLFMDVQGVARVLGSEITLDEVVAQFEDGTPAEEIAMEKGLQLSDVMLVLAFYMLQRSKVEGYLAERAAVRERALRLSA